MTVDEACRKCHSITEETPNRSGWLRVIPAEDDRDDEDFGRGVTIDIDARRLTADQLRRIASVLDEVKS